MSVNRLLLGVIVSLVFLSVLSVISPVEPSGISLSEGKNMVRFNDSEYFYVSSLVKLNSEIEVVSFFDGHETVGYVNFLGGLGEDFIIEDNVNYEIIMKENATLVLPY